MGLFFLTKCEMSQKDKWSNKILLTVWFVEYDADEFRFMVGNVLYKKGSLAS